MSHDAPLQLIPPPPAHLVDRWISDAQTSSETTLSPSSTRCDFCSASGYPCIFLSTPHATTSVHSNLSFDLPLRVQSAKPVKPKKQATLRSQDNLYIRILEAGKTILGAIGDCVFWILIIIPVVFVLLYQCYESIHQKYESHKQHRPRRNVHETLAKPDALGVNALVRCFRKMGILKVPPVPDQIETEPACMVRFCERCTPSEDLPWPNTPPPAYSPRED